MNRFFHQLAVGVKTVFNSYGPVSQLRPRVFLIVALVTVVFIPGSIFLLVSLTDSLFGWLSSFIPAWSFFESIPSWFTSTIGGIGQVLVLLSTFVLSTLIGGSVVLILISPLLSMMSEKLWVSYGGSPLPSGFWPFLRSIARAVWLAVKYLVLQWAMLFLCFLLSLVPIIGLVSPVLSIAVAIFFYGTSLADYALELAGKNIRDSYAFCNSNRGLIIGIALPFALAIFIPYVGRYIVLFVAPLCVAAAVKLVADVSVKPTKELKEQ
jgi:CysZ protein